MSLSQYNLQRSGRETALDLPGSHGGRRIPAPACPRSILGRAAGVGGGRVSDGAGSDSPDDIHARESSTPPRDRGEENLPRRTDRSAGTGEAANPPALGAAHVADPAQAECAAQPANPAMEPLSLATFWRGRRGSVAVETAIAVSLLVIAFAGVMQIVHSAWVSDRMDRAARSAARAIAFTPGANAGSLPGLACAAIRKELDLAEAFDCATTLSVEIENSLAPASLTESAGSEHATPAGELVRVRIVWSAGPWNPGILVQGDDADSRPVAIGIARLEPIEGT